jgi:hypothetical protein
MTVSESDVISPTAAGVLRAMLTLRRIRMVEPWIADELIEAGVARWRSGQLELAADDDEAAALIKRSLPP